MSCRAVAVVLVAALLACSRPQHSPDYARAAALWTELVRARPSDAAEDARAAEVLRLLEAVPGDSLDSAAAADLRQRIEAARKAGAEEREHRAALLVKAEGMRSPPAAIAPAPGPAPAAVPIAPGMSMEEFRAGHGGCFEPRGEADVVADDGGPRRGEAWLMKDEAACRERYPQLVGLAVLSIGGAVVGVAPAATVVAATQRQVPKPAELRRSVELAQLPDGGVGMVVDGGVVPLPPGARLLPADAGEIR